MLAMAAGMSGESVKSASKGVRRTKTMGDRRIRFCKACHRKFTPIDCGLRNFETILFIEKVFGTDSSGTQGRGRADAHARPS